MTAVIGQIDFETRSRVNLIKTGPRKYAECPDAAVLCMAYAIDDDDPVLWLPGDPYPDVLREVTEWRAWNAGFERAIWSIVCEKLYDWPQCPVPHQWVDTQARALLAGLPAALALAAIALGLPDEHQKSARGKYLIQKLCKPQRNGTWCNDPDLLVEMYDYCIQDVVTERAIGKKLPPMPHREHRIWCLTETMNETGVPLDVDAVHGAVGYAGRAAAALNEEASKAAGRQFDTVNQLVKVVQWCEGRGVKLDNLQAGTVDDALAGELPDDVRLVLEARRAAGAASVKKFAAAALRVCDDNRLRDTLRYHGAAPGRWSSVGVQLQNLKRPALTAAEAARWLHHLATRQTIPGVAYARGLGHLGDCVRGMIKAEPGHVFVASDYSQIEYRVLLWLAQDDKHLQAIRDGRDPYKDMAAEIYDTTYEAVAADERFAGKTAVLGCGYQSGPVGMIKFADGYGLVWSEDYAQHVVDAYRAEYPIVVSFWHEFNDAVQAAVARPGETFRVRRLFVRVLKNKKWLEVMLPSGRPLRYFLPTVENVEKKWPSGDTSMLDQTFYYGLDTYTRKWGRTATYGGRLVENATQGLSRDILAGGMLRAARAGLDPIMTVHDEVVCHVPVYSGNAASYREHLLEELNRHLLKLPSWAQGLPLDAEGWTGDRYRK